MREEYSQLRFNISASILVLILTNCIVFASNYFKFFDYSKIKWIVACGQILLIAYILFINKIHLGRGFKILMQVIVLAFSTLYLFVPLAYSGLSLQFILVSSIFALIYHFVISNKRGIFCKNAILEYCFYCIAFSSISQLSNMQLTLKELKEKPVVIIPFILIAYISSKVLNSKFNPEKSIIRTIFYVIPLLISIVLSFRSDTLFLSSISGSPIFHWYYYVGVIESIQNNGVLLYDIPSQYGFINLLIPYLFPAKLSWNKFYIFQSTLYLIVTVSVVCLIWRVGNEKSFIVRLMLIILFLTSFFFADREFIGPYPFPSSSVLRFFPTYLLLIYAVSINRYNLINSIVLGLIISISAFWSAESALYVLVTYFFIVFFIIHYKTDLKLDKLVVLEFIFLPIVLFIFEYIILATVYKKIYGVHFDYFRLFDHALGYATGYGYVELLSFGPGAIFLLLTIVALIKSYGYLKVYFDPVLSFSHVIIASAIFSISTYYIGRPVNQNITAMLPLISFCAIYFYLYRFENDDSLLNIGSKPILFCLLILMFSIFSSPLFYKSLKNISISHMGISSKLQSYKKEDLPIIDGNSIYYDDGDYIHNSTVYDSQRTTGNRWLPLPLQLLESPIDEPVRRIYLLRYFCRNTSDLNNIVYPANPNLSQRINLLVKDISNYYDRIETKSLSHYKYAQFSGFKMELCKEIK